MPIPSKGRKQLTAGNAAAKERGRLEGGFFAKAHAVTFHMARGIRGEEERGKLCGKLEKVGSGCFCNSSDM